MTTKLERIPTAAGRMGVSVSQAYREIKAGRLGPLIKLGERALAVPSEAVDGWIAARIAADLAECLARQGWKIRPGEITEAAMIAGRANRA